MGKKHKGHSWKQSCHGVLPASLSQSELDGVCDQKVRNYIVKVANASVGFSIAPAGIADIAGRERVSPGEGLGLA